MTPATENDPVSDARADWENRIALRTDEREDERDSRAARSAAARRASAPNPASPMSC